MTAEQVRSVVFQTSAIGGYKKSDVDLFLDEVAVCIESMTSKIRALEKAKFDEAKKFGGAVEVKTDTEEQEETPNLVEEIKPQVETPVHSTDIGISDNGLQSLLIRTQRLAEQIESDARSAAGELLNKAAEDAKDIIARADSQAEDTLEKANAILAEAERKEASINAAARAEAENIINEAVARSGQMLTATRERLKEEQEMCENLRLEFSQVRNVIVGFYEEQLEELRKLDIGSSDVEAPAITETEDIQLDPVAAEEEVIEEEAAEEEIAQEEEQDFFPIGEEETENSNDQFYISDFSEE